MNRAIAVVIGLLLLVMLVLFSTTYTVRFHEVAVKTTFGKTGEDSVQRKPGLHFRIPFFADKVTTYDTRTQLVQTPLVEVPTADGQSVVVRAFLMWKIDADNLLTFFGSFPESMEDADSVLRDQLQTAVKAGLGRYAFDDLIGAGSRLHRAEQDIRDQLASLGAMGIDPVTVGISQVLLPAKTTRAVLERMRATRQRLTETERTKGRSDAVGIQSEAKSDVDKLRAFADRRAEEIRGIGEARAAEYIEQMNVNPELAIFLVDLEALKASLESYTTVFLSDQQAPFHLLNQSRIGGGTIPKPDIPYVEIESDEPEDVASTERTGP